MDTPPLIVYPKHRMVVAHRTHHNTVLVFSGRQVDTYDASVLQQHEPTRSVPLDIPSDDRVVGAKLPPVEYEAHAFAALIECAGPEEEGAGQADPSQRKKYFALLDIATGAVLQSTEYLTIPRDVPFCVLCDQLCFTVAFVFEGSVFIWPTSGAEIILIFSPASLLAAARPADAGGEGTGASASAGTDTGTGTGEGQPASDTGAGTALDENSGSSPKPCNGPQPSQPSQQLERAALSATYLENGAFRSAHALLVGLSDGRVLALDCSSAMSIPLELCRACGWKDASSAAMRQYEEVLGFGSAYDACVTRIVYNPHNHIAVVCNAGGDVSFFDLSLSDVYLTAGPAAEQAAGAPDGPLRLSAFATRSFNATAVVFTPFGFLFANETGFVFDCRVSLRVVDGVPAGDRDACSAFLPRMLFLQGTGEFLATRVCSLSYLLAGGAQPPPRPSRLARHAQAAQAAQPGDPGVAGPGRAGTGAETGFVIFAFGERAVAVCDSSALCKSLRSFLFNDKDRDDSIPLAHNHLFLDGYTSYTQSYLACHSRADVLQGVREIAGIPDVFAESSILLKEHFFENTVRALLGDFYQIILSYRLDVPFFRRNKARQTEVEYEKEFARRQADRDMKTLVTAILKPDRPAAAAAPTEEQVGRLREELTDGPYQEFLATMICTLRAKVREGLALTHAVGYSLSALVGEIHSHLARFAEGVTPATLRDDCARHMARLQEFFAEDEYRLKAGGFYRQRALEVFHTTVGLYRNLTEFTKTELLHRLQKALGTPSAHIVANRLLLLPESVGRDVAPLVRAQAPPRREHGPGSFSALPTPVLRDADASDESGCGDEDHAGRSRLLQPQSSPHAPHTPLCPVEGFVVDALDLDTCRVCLAMTALAPGYALKAMCDKAAAFQRRLQQRREADPALAGLGIVQCYGFVDNSQAGGTNHLLLAKDAQYTPLLHAWRDQDSALSAARAMPQQHVLERLAKGLARRLLLLVKEVDDFGAEPPNNAGPLLNTAGLRPSAVLLTEDVSRLALVCSISPRFLQGDCSTNTLLEGGRVWCAPEVIFGRRYPSSVVFSIGLLVLHTLTGSLPLSLHEMRTICTAGEASEPAQPRTYRAFGGLSAQANRQLLVALRTLAHASSDVTAAAGDDTLSGTLFADCMGPDSADTLIDVLGSGAVPNVFRETPSSALGLVGSFSAHCIEFVSRSLVFCPAYRWSVETALASAWLAGSE